MAAVPVGLVGQHSADLTKRRIRDTASQMPVPQHPRHVQLFDDHHAMTTRKATRQFVQGVATNIAEVKRQVSGARPRFLKRGNPTLAPFRRPLELSH
jgi:hypothetical protein